MNKYKLCVLSYVLSTSMVYASSASLTDDTAGSGTRADTALIRTSAVSPDSSSSSSSSSSRTAVVVAREEPIYNTFVKKNKLVEGLIGQGLKNVPGLTDLVFKYTGEFFIGLNLHESTMQMHDDRIMMLLTVGGVKQILGIYDEPGDLLTSRGFSSSFTYKGKEFGITAYLPLPFTSRFNYNDDEVIMSYSMHVYTDPTSQKQTKDFKLRDREIFLHPKDRYKGWVGCPGAGLTDSYGALLDPEGHYLDGSIEVSDSHISVSEK